MAKLMGKHIGDVPGTIKKHGKGAAPAGYLLCDGSTVLQSAYPLLFSIIGTNFNIGGETAGTFRLPDCRRRVLVGAGGTGTATLGNTVGSHGGEEAHQLTAAELASHGHNATGSSPPPYALFNGDGSLQGSGLTPEGWINGTVSGTKSGDSFVTGTTLTGSTTASHLNMQPSLVVTHVIKY